ncbi:hypothetical protein TWF718_005228 [Orbilia javanica]|uniref:LysM domain-containing protein n=1 Tax=Orbilia javanica TaxID=47235 RepID=A0AAN8MRR7_9PEZI
MASSLILFAVLLFSRLTYAATSPWPTEPDIIATCSRWIEALPGDDCHILAEVDNISLADFLLWNPALARDCNGIKVGFGYCTENKGVVPTVTSRAATSTSSGTSACPSVSCPITVTITTTSFVTTVGTTTAATTTRDCRYPYSADYCPATSDICCPYNCAIAQVPFRVCQTSLQTVQASCTPCLYGAMTTSRSTTPSTSITTTTITTTETKTASKTSLVASMFPSASGTSQCVRATSPIPTPTQIASGNTLDAGIVSACNSLVGSSGKWLEIGDPYTVVLPVDGKLTTFLLNIKLGGFSVPLSMCLAQLRQIITFCTGIGPNGAYTYGGCSYTSDFNLLSCIFPNV